MKYLIGFLIGASLFLFGVYLGNIGGEPYVTIYLLTLTFGGAGSLCALPLR